MRLSKEVSFQISMRDAEKSVYEFYCFPYFITNTVTQVIIGVIIQLFVKYL